MRLTDSTKQLIDDVRSRWQGNTSPGGADVAALLDLIDTLSQRMTTVQEQLRDAQWHLKNARAAVATAKEEGRQEELEWRFQNGVHFASFPVPGDVCGHHRCTGILRAGRDVYSVRCEKCRVGFGPGPGALEALEAAEETGRQKAIKEMELSGRLSLNDQRCSTDALPDLDRDYDEAKRLY